MKNYAFAKVALTDRHLRGLKPSADGKRQTIWDGVQPSLAVRVSPFGRVAFYCVKRLSGQTQPSWVKLGDYPALGLSDAREKARETLSALMVGQHPRKLAEEKHRAAEAAARDAQESTFRAVAEKFARQYLRRIKSAKVYEGYLDRLLVPALGDRQMVDIRYGDVRELLETIAERSGEATARLSLSVLRRMMNWALGRKELPGYDSNPAAGIRVKDVIGEARSRDRLLSDPEAVAVWKATDAALPPYSTVFKILMLTGLRLREVAEATWDELDLEAGTFRIPAARAKSGEEQLVPLPPTAIALFDAMPRFGAGDFVFTTTAGRAPVQTFSPAKRRLDAAIKANGDKVAPYVTHDHRRLVRSGLGRLGVPPVVAELCLGHSQRGIMKTYDRYTYLDEKRAALALWESHLMGLVNPPPKGDDENIVLLRPATAA